MPTQPMWLASVALCPRIDVHGQREPCPQLCDLDNHETGRLLAALRRLAVRGLAYSQARARCESGPPRTQCGDQACPGGTLCSSGSRGAHASTISIAADRGAASVNKQCQLPGKPAVSVSICARLPGWSDGRAQRQAGKMVEAVELNTALR